MGKDTEKKLVSQPIFKQIIDILLKKNLIYWFKIIKLITRVRFKQFVEYQCYKSNLNLLSISKLVYNRLFSNIIFEIENIQ